MERDILALCSFIPSRFSSPFRLILAECLRKSATDNGPFGHDATCTNSPVVHVEARPDVDPPPSVSFSETAIFGQAEDSVF